jgi:hypothetical protein
MLNKPNNVNNRYRPKILLWNAISAGKSPAEPESGFMFHLLSLSDIRICLK